MTALTRKRTTLTTKGSLFQIRTLNKKRPQEKTLHSSSSNIICRIRLYYRKIRDQGSNFSHETEGLLASAATIKQSLYHKRTLINTRPQEKTSRSSISPISQEAL